VQPVEKVLSPFSTASHTAVILMGRDLPVELALFAGRYVDKELSYF
jgi:hypothetical protein